MKKGVFYIITPLVILFFLLPFIGILYEMGDLEDWRYLLQNSKSYEGIKNSVIVASIAIILNVLIGTPTASVLAKEEFRGKKMIEVLVLLPLIIPGFVTTMGIQMLFIKLSLIDTVLGVGIIHGVITLPYYIRAMKVGYEVINRNYENMGRIMGASDLQIFLKINFPMLLPAFIAGISLVVIVSFAQYLVTLIIGGGAIITIPILMFPYMVGGDVKIGAIYSIIYIVINICLLLLLERAIKEKVGKKE